jgi:transcriptional regulator with XRE-family HTH domain
MARAGLCFSLREVARRAGVSPESVRRVEQGDPSVQLDTLCAVAEAVGIDVVVTGYPATGISLRDAGQLTVARIICSMAHPSWQPQLEVPAGEHGEAIDLVLFGPDEIIAAEIDRRLLDFQETHRRNVRKRDHLAAQHQRPVRSVLVTEDTRRNRQAVEPHLELIRSVFPAGSREVLNAVRSGEPLGRDGLVWMRPYRLLPTASKP